MAGNGTRQGTKEAIGALVRAAQKGDQRAWDQLVRRFDPLVLWAARQRGLSAADANDVRQTTWLRCVQSIVKIRDPESIGSWLVTTARREAGRISQHDGRQVLVGQENEHQLEVVDANSHVDPEIVFLNEERDISVRNATTRLSERSRELLAALMAEDRPDYVAIAQKFDMPVGSIGPTRARYLKHLRQTPEILAITSNR